MRIWIALCRWLAQIMNFLLCLWKYCCDPIIINLFFFGPEIRIVKRCDRLDTLRSFCEVSIWLLVVWSTYVWFPQLRSGEAKSHKQGNQKPWKIHWNHERKDSSDFGSLGNMEPFMIVYVHEWFGPNHFNSKHRNSENNPKSCRDHPTTSGLAEQVFGCEDKCWDPETGCFPRDMKNLHGIPNALVIKVFTDSGNHCP